MQLSHRDQVDDGTGASMSPTRRPRPQVSAPPAAPAVQRNDVCPCGNGNKFRECHGAALEEDEVNDSGGITTPVETSAAEPCICGSGLAFSKCHGKATEDASAE